MSNAFIFLLFLLRPNRVRHRRLFFPLFLASASDSFAFRFRIYSTSVGFGIELGESSTDSHAESSETFHFFYLRYFTNPDSLMFAGMKSIKLRELDMMRSG